MSEKVELTEEQKVTIAAENERQLSVSYEFMTRHLDFVRNARNAKLISDYLKETGQPWTVEALEDAFAYLSNQNLLDPTPGPEEAAPVPSPAADLPPWGEHLTKLFIRNATKDEIRAIYKSKWAQAFEAAVRELKIQR